MKPAILFLISMILSTGYMFAQSDYRISNARKAKVGYTPYEHDAQVKELDWTSLESSCLTGIKYGAWFEIGMKSAKLQFNVHTGGRMGTIADPALYLGKVVEERGVRKITEVACVVHSGKDGLFSIEADGLDPAGQYFVLVVSAVEKTDFGFSVTDKFEIKAPVKDASPPSNLNTIYGRITDVQGQGRPNLKVRLLNEGQIELAQATTDNKGVFKFEKLPVDQVYLAQIEAEDTDLKVEMFLLDRDGKISSRATRIGDKLFGFGVDAKLAPYLKLLAEPDYALIMKPNTQGIVGRVVDKKTFLFGRAGVKVKLYSPDKSLLASSTTDKDGSFSFNDLAPANYQVQIELNQQDDYAEVVVVDDLSVPIRTADSDDLDSEGFFAFKSLPKEIVSLKRMEAQDTKMESALNVTAMATNQPIVLQNILFGYGSADLLPSSFKELDILAKQLSDVKGVRIEVSGHTDDQGAESTNLILSENRAKAVVSYLIDKGIDPARLAYKGYGKTKPVADNNTEEGTSKNRRVEFMVID